MFSSPPLYKYGHARHHPVALNLCIASSNTGGMTRLKILFGILFFLDSIHTRTLNIVLAAFLYT